MSDLWEVDTAWWMLDPVRRHYWHLALGCRDGEVVRQQRSLAAVFLTLEVEHGPIPLAVDQPSGNGSRARCGAPWWWKGVSRRDDTLNVPVQKAWPVALDLGYYRGQNDWRRWLLHTQAISSTAVRQSSRPSSHCYPVGIASRINCT